MKETKLLSSTGVAETTNERKKREYLMKQLFFLSLVFFSSNEIYDMIYDLINELKPPQQKTKSFFSLFSL